MSLVKKNRIDHFGKNKKNKNKKVKAQGEQMRRLSADMKELQAAAAKK